MIKRRDDNQGVKAFTPLEKVSERKKYINNAIVSHSGISLSRCRMRKRSLTGFTLIEMVISIVILIVGLVGVLLIIPLAQRASGRSALASRASILASEKIEELKSKGYAELTSQSEWSGTSDVFTWKAVLSDVTDDDFQEIVSLPSDPLVKIVIEITYRDHGKERREKFVTFYSEL